MIQNLAFHKKSRCHTCKDIDHLGKQSNQKSPPSRSGSNIPVSMDPLHVKPEFLRKGRKVNLRLYTLMIVLKMIVMMTQKLLIGQFLL